MKKIKIETSQLNEISEEFFKADNMLLEEAMADITNFAKYDKIHKQLEKAIELLHSHCINVDKS